MLSSQSSSDGEIPSKLTVDYHPLKDADYYFIGPHQDEEEHEESDVATDEREDDEEGEEAKNDEENDKNEDEEWFLDDGYCAFQKCKLFKTDTIKMSNNSSSLIYGSCL